MPYLEFEDQRRALGPGVLTIGSGTEASWRIQNRDLAPLHAIVTLTRQGHALVERGESLATIAVNGVELEEGRGSLRFGDSLRVGGLEFTFLQTANATARGDAYLRDTRRGRSYKLVSRTQLGRDPKCAVFIQEPEVSRVHAEIVRDRGRYLLQPTGRAYLLLNGNRLHDVAELKEGDEIAIGRTVFRFSAEPGPYRTAEPLRPGSHPLRDRRSVRMHTVYMGAIQARERMVRGERRKLGMIVAIVIAVGMIVASLLTG